MLQYTRDGEYTNIFCTTPQLNGPVSSHKKLSIYYVFKMHPMGQVPVSGIFFTIIFLIFLPIRVYNRPKAVMYSIHMCHGTDVG